MSANTDRNARRSRWKAITFDYNRVLEQEQNSSTIHCLSPTTRFLLMSALDMIKWTTRYDVPYGESVDKDVVIGWYEKAAYELSEGQMLRGNGCKIESSCDGVNWVTLVDFGQCMIAAPVNIESAITYESNMVAVNDDYDGTQESIGAGNTVYDGTVGDTDRDAALCTAIKAYVSATAQTWAKKEDVKDSRNKLIATATVDLAAGLLSIATASVGILVAGAIGSAVATLAINLIVEDKSEMTAPETVNAVACKMYNALRGDSVSQVQFADSLDGQGDPDGSYIQKLTLITDAVNKSGDSYLAFLKLWSETVGYVEDGLVVDECQSCAVSWEAQLDLAVAEKPTEVDDSRIGSWVANEGIMSACVTENGTTKRGSEFRINMPVSVDIRKIKTYYKDLVIAETSPVRQARNGGHDGSSSLEWWCEYFFGELQPGDGVFVGTRDEVEPIALLYQYIFSDWGSCGGGVTVNKIGVVGDGECPLDGLPGWEVFYSS